MIRAFETVYRTCRAKHTGKALFIEFSKAIHAEFGLTYTDRDRGHDNWAWSQNELRFGLHQDKETVKSLCYGTYWRVVGPLS
ncbi:MAG: hypothetical protein CME17_04070 [Gemmatimonadetes bacterium]|nr:hypothetical protein [Gemmatimonadota bacterium]